MMIFGKTIPLHQLFTSENEYHILFIKQTFSN